MSIAMRVRFAVLVATVAFTLAGCGGSDGNGGDDAGKLVVLAGSELKDVEPLLPRLEKETGVKLKFSYIGTLDGAEKLMGDADRPAFAWFSHGKYIALLQGSRGKSVKAERIMLSPVIMGVKKSLAAKWGWDGKKPVTWRDIAAKSAKGELHYAMTNPAASNSGFTALLGVSAAFAGSADALSAEKVDDKDLKAFFKGQALTAGSSGWLAEAYEQDQDKLDGIINYESVLLGLNAGGKLHEPLTLIYPQEGIVTADYPLMLIDESQKAAYDKVVAFFQSEPIQRELMTQTSRRPVAPSVALDGRFPNALLVELPFPNNLEVIDRILTAYLDQQRVAGHAIFVLDTSGSMQGDGMGAMTQALNNLAANDTSITGRFARFRLRERLTFETFSSEVNTVQQFDVDDVSQQGAAMSAIRAHVAAMKAGGKTAIYSALQRAYEVAGTARKADPQRYYTIVLMSDGSSNSGLSQSDFANWRLQHHEVVDIRTFTVAFGDADVSTLKAIADMTGGRFFDGRKESLALVFKQIRGYQ